MSDVLFCGVLTPEMRVCQSTRWRPGQYRLPRANGIIVETDNLLLDFTGVLLVGGDEGARTAAQRKALHEEFSYGDDTDETERVRGLGYFGNALTLRNVKNVTVRGLTARGFETAILAEGCENLRIEGCDLSGNFHDPDCGWKEHPPRGGIVLLRSHGCVLRNNRATHVWNGLCLRESHGNLVQGNDFSCCSNMCVKMWNACHNRIDSNNLSWGLRILPGEVHARDSAGLLMESGSDHNTVCGNDLTHGGDGLFVRVLNGWHSRFNLFADNDCSWANNNAIEAWANDNTYLRNKANHSSYGFWLGGSDNTVLEDNEAAYNGGGFHNAPESFGNAGVAVVNGSGTNLRMLGNRIHDNYGPGLALRHEKSHPLRHAVIEGNLFCNNRNRVDYRGHGVYLKNVRDLSFSNNSFSGNEGEDIFCDENTERLNMLEDGDDYVSISAEFPDAFARVGQRLSFACTPSRPDATVFWDFGDGTEATGNRAEKSYRQAGTYHVGVTACSGSRAVLDGKILHLLPVGAELPTKSAAFSSPTNTSGGHAEWANGEASFYSSDGCERTVTLQLEKPVSLGDKNRFSYLLHQHSEAETDWEKSVPSPIVCLRQDEANQITVRAKHITSDILFNETAKTWEKVQYRYYELPLDATSELFEVERIGDLREVREVSITIRHKFPGRFWGAVREPVLHRAIKQPPATPAPGVDQAVLKSLHFKLNLERTGEADPAPGLLVRLYRCEGGQPSGAAFFSAQLSPAEIRPGKVNSIDMGGLTLARGRYAASFEQSLCTQGPGDGAYYRFPSSVRADGEKEGVRTETGWKDETGTWGTLWLQVETQGGLTDLSHESEGYGARIGVPAAQERYQTFTLP